jgi:hypothetical protein
MIRNTKHGGVVSGEARENEEEREEKKPSPAQFEFISLQNLVGSFSTRMHSQETEELSER